MNVSLLREANQTGKLALVSFTDTHVTRLAAVQHNSCKKKIQNKKSVIEY